VIFRGTTNFGTVRLKNKKQNKKHKNLKHTPHVKKKKKKKEMKKKRKLGAGGHLGRRDPGQAHRGMVPRAH